MIGIYDYTVILTYLSLLSGSLGIVLTLSGGGYPNIGIFFLLFCGLCDSFDGKVASMKKKRSTYEKNYGVQIDSLSDLVAFGVLPFSIGIAIYRTSAFLQGLTEEVPILPILLYGVLLLYVLAALIRLAHFNVTEEERQKVEEGKRKYYTGLPVTSASIILPLVLLVQNLTSIDLSLLYFFVILFMAFLFVFKFRIKKLDMKMLCFFVLLGIIELVIFLVFKCL